MMSSDRDAPDPLTRELIRTPFASGIRAIDTFIPMAKGQRIGVFAGSGVGKSTLLAMMVAGSDADVIVVGLVGERGREVREFIEDELGEKGLAKSIVVVATGDESLSFVAPQQKPQLRLPKTFATTDSMYCW